jgi:Mg2+/Co2+ transporter CorB
VSTSALVALLLILILLSAFFSASEISMMAINRYRLKHLATSGNRAAGRVSKLLERPDRLLGIILLGNNFVNILASSVATIIALRLYGEAAIAAAAGLLTLVILIFSEVAPKTMAANKPERVAFPAAFVLGPLLTLLYPIVWFINLIANWLLRLLGAEPEIGSTKLSSDELRAAVLEAGGLIPESHKSMLLAILDLEKMTVEDVMVPRGRIVGIDLDADWDTIAELISGSRYTRLPLYRGSLDKVVGTVHLRKLIGPLKTGKLDKALIEQIMVEPYFIPEGTPLTTQLLNFRSARRRRGLVVDEYGDILGLVTLEEILEEIVGDFTTETLAAPDLAQPQEDGSFLIPGSAAIRDLNRQLHWHLPLGDSRTLNGLITEYLEDLPVPGTSLLVGDYLVEVVQTRGPVIQVARLQQRQPVTENSDKHSDIEES